MLVIEGTTPLGTLRSTSLPEFLPDWIVYDRAIAPSKGGILLGPGTAKAAGLFETDWSLKLVP